MDCWYHFVVFLFQFDLTAIRTNSTHLDLRKIDEFNQTHLHSRLNDSAQCDKLVSSLKELLVGHYGNK